MSLYFGIVVLMLAFAIVAGGLIIAFLRHQKKILAKQREMHVQEMKHKQDLLANSIQSAEEERMRVAKDVHDEIGSIFSTLSLSVNQMKAAGNVAPEQISVSKGLIESGISSVRRISHAIAPFELELLGLRQTLENHLATVNAVSGLNIQFKCEYDLSLLNNTAALCFYRIVQELTSNCIKYAGAQNVTFDIRASEDCSQLLFHYRDDGRGMDVQEGGFKGIGLKNIESRMMLMNGTLEIKSAAGKGFAAGMIIPLIKNTTC